jgi:hypothetical protein
MSVEPDIMADKRRRYAFLQWNSGAIDFERAVMLVRKDSPASLLRNKQE